MIPSDGAEAVTASAHGTDDDVLLAFLNVVDQDSRDRSGSSTHDSNATVTNTLAEFSMLSSGERPRTSRGNTASSSKSHDLTEGDESDPSTITGHGLDLRGRRASSYARPRSGVDSGDKSSARARSSAGARSRGTTGDGSSSAGRPSTAVGDAVKAVWVRFACFLFQPRLPGAVV